MGATTRAVRAASGQATPVKRTRGRAASAETTAQTGEVIAAGRRAPAKRAPRAAARKAPEVVKGSVVGEDEKPAGVRTAVVPFRGRDIEVQLPSLEQLTIFKRVADRFAGLQANAEAIDAKAAVGHYDRALRVITSVVVRAEDVAWIEDEMLDGNLTLADATPLIRDAIAKLQEANAGEGNRAQRRARARRTT